MNILHLDLPLVEQADRSSSDNNIPGAAASPPEENIRKIAASGKAGIVQRLMEIDDEWTIDGIFEKGAAIITAGSFALGMMFDYRWFVVPLLIAILLFQRAVQGWCPVFSALRELGFRTEREILFERHALEDIKEEMSRCHCAVPRSGLAEGTVSASPAPTCAKAFSLREFLL